MRRLRDLAVMVLFALLVRPFLILATGLHVYGREKLPLRGPAVIAANHNSHLDVLALMSLFPLGTIKRVRPVAAADHFMRPGPIGWLARTLLNLIPIERSGQGAEVALEPVREALDRGDIVIVFPEGTRGQPEVLSKFRRGASVLATKRPDVAFTPVYLHGFGKSLPRGDWRFVPFACEAHIGNVRFGGAEGSQPMSEVLRADIETMAEQTTLSRWAIN